MLWLFYVGAGIFAMDLGLLCFGYPREFWQKGSFVPFSPRAPIHTEEMKKNWKLRNKRWYSTTACIFSFLLWIMSHSLLSELGVDFLPLRCGSAINYTE